MDMYGNLHKQIINIKIYLIFIFILGALRMGKRIRRTFRIPESADYKVTSYMGKHNLTRTDAVLRIFKEHTKFQQKLKEQDEKITLLNQTVEMLRDMENSPSLNKSLKLSTELSEKPCEALGYNKNEDPYCMNPDAPISTEARRNFNVNVCQFCRKKRLKTKQKKAKSTKTRKLSTSTLNKKLAKTYCVGLHKDIDPLLNQAKCHNCSTKSPKTWIQCKQKQLSTTT